eukprot:2389433-Pyramimonas_sp.AAC.1
MAFLPTVERAHASSIEGSSRPALAAPWERSWGPSTRLGSQLRTQIWGLTGHPLHRRWVMQHDVSPVRYMVIWATEEMPYGGGL